MCPSDVLPLWPQLLFTVFTCYPVLPRLNDWKRSHHLNKSAIVLRVEFPPPEPPSKPEYSQTKLTKPIPIYNHMILRHL